MSDFNELERMRLQKAELLRRAGIDPYPARARRTHTTAEAVTALDSSGEAEAVEAAVVGRLRSIRRMGRATFAHIEDGSGTLQLYLRQDDLGPAGLRVLP